ncbi:MAG: hypothetical protein WCO94_17490, partial [Verrucomicrobiota bacterium]
MSICSSIERELAGSPSAAMFRRERGLRGFDEAFFNSADWEMWLHLLEQGCFGYISEPLVAYREHAGQQTGKDRHTLTESRDQLGILDRYLDRPYVRLAKLCKRYLRHRAIADLVNRGRQLGHPEEKVLAGKGTLFAPLSPVLFGYRHYLQTRRFMESALRRCQRQNAGKRMDQFSPGLNVAGFFKGEYGVGDTSRTFLKVIRESRLPAVFININSRNHRNLDRSFDCFSRKNPHSVNLMTFSFDYARRFYRDRGKRYFKHRYNIGIWFCELENLAPRWHHCFDYYDEIWVTTRFCQKSLAAVSPIPVTRINYPFYPGEAPAPDRDGFGFDRDAFLFLFNFDFHSVVERKNPAGLIAAFSKAFGGGKENAVLILKSINARHYPALAAELQRVTANLNVRWINEHLDGPRMKQLFATADCYVSLHRSEGLGLGMARAMSFGKPVIA